MSTSKDIINYTDFHDVNEDLRTIMAQGGMCLHGDGVGITFRSLTDSPTLVSYSVASRRNITQHDS